MSGIIRGLAKRLLGNTAEKGATEAAKDAVRGSTEEVLESAGAGLSQLSRRARAAGVDETVNVNRMGAARDPLNPTGRSPNAVGRPRDTDIIDADFEEVFPPRGTRVNGGAQQADNPGSAANGTGAQAGTHAQQPISPLEQVRIDEIRSNIAAREREAAANVLSSRISTGRSVLVTGAVVVGGGAAMNSAVQEDGYLNTLGGSILSIAEDTAAVTKDTRIRDEILNNSPVPPSAVAQMSAPTGIGSVMTPDVYRASALDGVNHLIDISADRINDPVKGLNFPDVTQGQVDCVKASFASSLDETVARVGVPTTVTQGLFNSQFSSAVQENLSACNIGTENENGFRDALLEGPKADTSYLVAGR